MTKKRPSAGKKKIQKTAARKRVATKSRKKALSIHKKASRRAVAHTVISKKQSVPVSRRERLPKNSAHGEKVVKKKEKKVRHGAESGENEGFTLGLTPMRIYLNQIEHIPLLTPEDEIELSKKIQHKLPGWKQARERMIKSNLRLVINIAKRYANMGLTFSDLVEEGNIGLMRAVGKFNYAKGYRFSTYASWWIKQGMMRALSNQSKMIRIPVHMYESITKWRKCREIYIQRFGRIPERKEIAAQMQVSEDKVEEIEGVLNSPGSLNVPLSLDSSNELIDMIEDTAGQQPHESSSEMIRNQTVDDLVKRLNEREQRIITLRFGMYGEEPRTLELIAQEFGVTRERVRQIEEAALKKLRALAAENNVQLTDYL